MNAGLRAAGLACAGVLLSCVFWYALGYPHALPEILEPGKKLQCISYTPFRGNQSPMEEFHFERRQIEQDLALLGRYFDCVRIYSVKGMEDVPVVARAQGLKLIAGAWLNREDADNDEELAGAIHMANQYPDVVSAVVVGNEVLLRRERSGDEIVNYLRRVKAAIKQPVTYADVWDFWLLNPQVAGAVDFITIHLLPYWENDPSGIEDAIAAVAHAHDEIARRFPGQDILIGETGWPSEGRQREDALPTRLNQARFIRGFVATAAQKGWRYNLIEAFDQPWKRLQEGTVGGFWGLFDEAREDKHSLMGPVSNLPSWPRWIGISIALGIGLFACGGWRSASSALIATLGANLGAYHLYQGSLGIRNGDELLWNLALFAISLTIGIAWLRRPAQPQLPRWLGQAVWLLAALAASETLRITFDSRYRCFPVAVFVMPALVLLAYRRAGLPVSAPQRVLGAAIAACLPVMLFSETLLNLQALAWVATMSVLAMGLVWPMVPVHANAAPAPLMRAPSPASPD